MGVWHEKMVSYPNIHYSSSHGMCVVGCEGEEAKICDFDDPR